MKQNIPTSATHTAVASLVALAAGVGIAFVAVQALGSSGWFAMLIATPSVLVLLLYMLRGAAESAFEHGALSAAIDAATRLPSPAVARQLLQREFAAAERGRPLTVVVFSLDNLPRLAARHPDAAAKVMLGVGAIFKRRTRGMNMSARLDEAHMFVSVLGGVDEIGAQKFVSKVRADLSTLNIAGQPLAVRSGICSYDPHMHQVDELIERARAALAGPELELSA